ncbi:MAG: hypothetical protein ACLUOI_35280 [Eisenbergiella sp.]
MKKMRKAVSILLAGCLVLGLSACGGRRMPRRMRFTDCFRAKGGWRARQNPLRIAKPRMPEKVEISFSMAAYSMKWMAGQP